MLHITTTLHSRAKYLLFKTIIVTFVCNALLACSGFRSPPELAQQVPEIHSTIEEYSARGARANDEQKLDLANSQLWFPAIAGHIYGTPNIDLKWKPEQQDDQFQIQGKQLIAELATQAKPFDGRETSVLVTPKATRIARVVPFLLNQFDGEPVGQSNWRNPSSNKSLLLVYFDRPCRMLGSLFHDKREVRFDIEIPKRGLYWLEQRRSWFGPEKYVNGTALKQTVLAVHKP